MKPQVIRPRRRIPWRRVVAGIAIAWSSWCASRVLEGMERADREARIEQLERGPYCPSTVWCSDGARRWCEP